MTNTKASAPKIAQALIDNGYTVVPLPRGQKGPKIPEWNILNFSADEFSQSNGVGIQTRQGVVALDLDVYDPTIVDNIVAEFELRFGPTLRRTGRAPKTALLARCDVPKKLVLKLRASGFAPLDDKGKVKSEQVEVLTTDQQLVAFGTHPETGRQYQWHGKAPWDDGMESSSLPHITIEGLEAFLVWVAENYGDDNSTTVRRANQYALSAPAGKLPAEKAHRSNRSLFERQPSTEEVREILSQTPTPADYDTWFRAFMGLKSLGDEYYDLADEWSSRGASYDAENNRRIWDAASEDGGITFATVAAMARENGANLSAIATRHIGGAPSTALAITGSVAVEQELVKQLDRRVAEIFASRNLTVPADLAPGDPTVIQSIFSGVFYNPKSAKYMFLNLEEHLNEHPEKDAWKFIARKFGAVFDFEKAKHLLGDVAGSDPAAGKAVDALHTWIKTQILDDIRFRNQRARVEWFVDMFDKHSRLELMDDKVRIVIPHRPFLQGSYNTQVIDDFRAHFPEFDEFLRWIAASRFAIDRKLAYLWLLLPSDFGKGLMMGKLKDIGAVVEMSVKEIEAAFEGKPLGRTAEDFRRALILWVDEFKTVKSELKQIQSTMSISAKFELSATVQLYAKVFTSAENVPSLVSEHGVEDQFANRMSILSGQGTVVDRPLFKKNQVDYARSLQNYMAETLNNEIAQFISLGHDAAALKAMHILTTFAENHGIGKHAGRVSEAIPALAEHFRQHALSVHSIFLHHRGSDGAKILSTPRRHLENWLGEQCSPSERPTLSRRIPEMIEALSVDGKGVQTYFIKGDLRVRGVRIE